MNLNRNPAALSAADPLAPALVGEPRHRLHLATLLATAAPLAAAVVALAAPPVAATIPVAAPTNASYVAAALTGDQVRASVQFDAVNLPKLPPGAGG
jgi:hypothetical protein